jgi:voltage-gated potassium channel
VPRSLRGRTLSESSIRRETDCTVIAVETKEGLNINPDPKMPLPEDAEIILIGSVESENKFFKVYGDS